MGPVPRSFVALVTDFGSRDPYAGAVKAVIAGRCPATIIDLTHEIAPGDVFEAAWFLRSVARFLPRAEGSGSHTVCMTVVDPGVGSERRIIALSSRGVVHLAPDNGVLSFVAESGGTAFSVVNEELFLQDGSTTFHGRDRFSPVAAALASGASLERLGPQIDVRDLVRLPYCEAGYAPGSAAGQVVSIDRFGNLVTDIEAARCRAVGILLAAGDSVEISAVSGGGRSARWRMIVRSNYASPHDRDEPFALIGSQGTVEISVALSSAAEVLQIARFDRIELMTPL